MAFFKNSAINRIYMHAGLQSFAVNAGGAFIYVYMLKAGIAVQVVLLTIAAVMLSRLILRPLVVPLAKRIGLRNTLVFGTILDASSYLLLPKVDGLGLWLVAYVALASFGTAFYWTCYHACVAQLGDEEHRGAQVSAREAIAAMSGIIGPLFGGLVLTFLGPFYAFAAATLVYVLAAWPLLYIDRMPVDHDAEISRADRNFAFGVAFSDGIVAASVNFLWRIVLFQTLGEKFDAFGGALAIAGLAGAVMGLGIGKLIDRGFHHQSTVIGLAAMAIGIVIQAFGFATPWSAIAANMFVAAAAPLYMSAIVAPLYSAGAASGCTLRFNVHGENGFDSGAGTGCLIAALLLWMGFSYLWPLIMGLSGCVALYVILRGRMLAG
jgi:MFS transporter, DHA1 family, inner membrane transport protein